MFVNLLRVARYSWRRRRDETRIVATRVAMGALSMSVVTICAYWQSRKVAIEDGILLEAIFCAAIVVLEVPSGHFADRFSRKLAMMLGVFALALSDFAYAVGTGFNTFVIAELLCAAGLSFASGADEALLMDRLKQRGKAHEFESWWGKSSFWESLAGGFFGVIGGLLATWALVAPWIVAGVILLIGFVLVAGVEDSPRARPLEDNAARPRMQDAVLLVAVQSAELRYFALAGGVMWATTLAAFWQWQSLWTDAGIPLAFNGMIFLAYRFFSAIGARHAASGGSALCRREISFMLLGAGFAALCASFVGATLAIVLLAVQQYCRARFDTRISAAVQAAIDDEQRATVRSVVSLAMRAISGAAMVPTSLMVGLYGSTGGLLVAAVVGIGGAVVLSLDSSKK